MSPPGRSVWITGIGAVSPNGIGRNAFWEACRRGTSGVRRLDLPGFSELPVRIAGSVEGFDEEAWISGRDRRHVSRAVPLALAAAAEALEDAGFPGGRVGPARARDFGVLIGSGGGQLVHTEEQYRRWFLEGGRGVSVYTISTATIGTFSSEVSTRFGLHGPSHVVSTGCTSSTDALGYALRSTRHGYLDRVLVVGADAPIAPGILRGFCNMKILTSSWNEEPERGSRPFSRDRDGFVLGEGAWALVVEVAEAAEGRGARPYCELAGYGSTCDAYHRVRLEESGEEPARAVSIALEDAGAPRESVDYVSLHGTSTVLNDRIETRALRIAFGHHADRIAASALKSMIGHPQGACGAAGVAATALAIRDRFVHPTINRDEPDPECDLDVVPHQGRPAEIGAAVCNCIAFGSKNSALVLKATPPGRGE